MNEQDEMAFKEWFFGNLLPLDRQAAAMSSWQAALEWRDSQAVPVARVQHGNAGCIYWLPETNALKLPDQSLLYLQKPTQTG